MTKITGKILSTLDDEIIETGEKFLDVTVGFFHDDEDEPRETRKLGFSPKKTKKEILAEIKKVVAEYATTLKNAGAQAEVDAENERIEELKADLDGEEVTA